MADYEERYVSLLKRVGELSGELRMIHDELCSLYLEKRIDDHIKNKDCTPSDTKSSPCENDD